MKVVVRDDDSGVSEVVGTILILAMTVVLFSTIIVWVTSIPTPIAQTRIDILGSLSPQYKTIGGGQQETGDWINLTHQGGESLPAFTTVIYVADQKPSSPVPTTDVVRLHLFRCTTVCSPAIGIPTTGTQNGLLDGTGTSWSVGQRFSYYSSNLSVSDTITVTVVDTSRGLVLWSSQLSAPVAQRPIVFLNVWASASLTQPTPITPLSGSPVYIFAQVMDPSGYSNIKSVYTNITILWGKPNTCAGAQKMYDDHTNGDQVPQDGIFTWARTNCPAAISWDGTYVLFNATDVAGRVSSTRLVLHVLPGAGGGNNGGAQNGTTGRPPYLFWNGNQGYNIFNLTQWQQWTGLGIQPKPTRTFASSEQVVLVVGSGTLQDISSADTFNLIDPLCNPNSGTCSPSVVYGSTKTVNLASTPSSLQGFNFYQFVNGYYLYTYQFVLNPSSGTANYYTLGTALHPPYYYFARYPLSIYLKSSTAATFSATDSINITSNTGAYTQFPQITTCADANCNTPSNTFSSTSVMYVRLEMLSADSIISNVNMGTVMIEDFTGGTELWRAPINGYQSNMPICPRTGSCSLGTPALTPVVSQNAYYFAVNLSRVNQNPWVPGTQHYSFGILSIQDSDESYGSVTVQVVITAPLYRMDVVAGTPGSGTNAWGTSNYLYYFQNYNGFDWWKPLRVDYCQGTGFSTSGIGGNGANCPSTDYVRAKFGNFFSDGTLGIVETISAGTAHAVEIYRRGVDATGSVVYLPVFNAMQSISSSSPGYLPEACNAIAVGDVTGVGVQSVICAGTDGRVWYYRNDGNWTFVWVDQVGSGSSITSISVGDFNGDGANDISVVGTGGFIAWYPNLDKHGTFQNPGFSTFQPALTDVNTLGTVTQGTYLNTYPSATSPEVLKEQTITVPLQSGATANPGFDTGASPWTYAPIQGTTIGAWVNSGGITTGYANASASFTANTKAAGFWSQSFITSGSQPYTMTLNVSYKVLQYNAQSVQLYAWVSSSAAAPPVSPGSGWLWATQLTGTTGWSSIQVPFTSANWTNPTKIPSPGTYYLKLEMVVTYGAAGGTTTVGFDNVQLTWTSTPGPTSALQHYWYLGTMPTRPGITFSFVLSAQGNASLDFDNYTFAYSTNVVGSDPTVGTPTWTAIPVGTTGNVTSALVNANVSIVQNLQGLNVWIRALDTNRVANSAILDTLTVYRLYMYTFTRSTTPTIQVITVSGLSVTVTTSNAGDQNGDGISDLVVGTASWSSAQGGAVFLFLGSRPTGLFSNSNPMWRAAGGVGIVSVKFGNILGNVSRYGLQLVASTGTNVYFVNPSSPGTTFGNPIAAPPGQGPITAMGVGDVNGDGVDDVVIGTGGGTGSNTWGFVLFYANFGTGYSWSLPVTIYNLGALAFYNLAIGDAANSLYVGR